jgi:hypothetical protein
MTRIVFVDPQDIGERHWWPAVVVDPLDYSVFFKEMGEAIDIENEFLVCYFEDASYSSVKKEEIIDMSNYLKKLNLGNVLNKISNQSLEKKRKSIDNTDNNEFDKTSNSNNKIMDLESIYNFTQFNKETNKWLNSRSIRAALKLYTENKIPVKFKWLKKKSSRTYKKKRVELVEDRAIRKKLILARALNEFKDEKQM